MTKGNNSRGGAELSSSALRKSSTRGSTTRSSLKKNKLRSIRRRKLETAESAPEAHFVGEIVGGRGFDSGVSCKWMIEAGEGWEPLDGEFIGQTQCDYPFDSGEICIWAHPIDVHYAMKAATAWPRIVVQVWKLDGNGQQELAGYGFTHLPTVPGIHEVEISTWRPLGHSQEEISSFFIGGTDRLAKDSFDAIFAKSWVQRCHLKTVGAGVVMLNMAVVLKHFAAENVECAPKVDARDHV
jgi:B9 domain-containing protein 2